MEKSSIIAAKKMRPTIVNFLNTTNRVFILSLERLFLLFSQQAQLHQLSFMRRIRLNKLTTRQIKVNKDLPREKDLRRVTERLNTTINVESI